MLDYLQKLCWEISQCTLRQRLNDTKMYFAALEFHNYLIFLIRNGFSVFYPQLVNSVNYKLFPSLSNLTQLGTTHYSCFLCFVAPSSSYCLSDTDAPPVFQSVTSAWAILERKRDGYQMIRTQIAFRTTCTLTPSEEIIKSFDAGPLALEQLSRIAIRRAECRVLCRKSSSNMCLMQPNWLLPTSN